MVVVPLCTNVNRFRRRILESHDEYLGENPLLIPTLDSEDPALLQYFQPKNWNQGKVVVSNIMKGSAVHTLHLIKTGDIIETAQKKAIHSVPQLRQIIENALKNKEHLHLTFATGKKIDISSEKVKEEEEKLKAIYNF